jgi:hypothetical protein
LAREKPESITREDSTSPALHLQQILTHGSRRQATFDVPAEAVRFQSPNGWAKILGPNSFAAKLYKITQMPEALNIETPEVIP